jgi:type I restriction enzyme S subunit
MTTPTDLPDGFKETPLGLFPREWDIETIGDLFNIQQGKSLSPKQREGKSPHPFLRTANIYWGKIDLTKVDQMDFTDEEVAKLALQPNDLLVCEGGDIGRAAMWRGAMENCCYQNHLHRLRARNADICPEFYMYWMQAAFTLFGLYGGEGNKTTIPNLSQGRLKAFQVPKPSFQEQQAIAAALTAVRRAIESTEAIIAAARETKRAMMQHVFTYGPVPLTEAGAVAIKETIIGDMPEGWEVVRLETAIDAAEYGLNNRAEVTGTYPVFRMNNLVDGLVDTTDLKYVELSSAELAKYRLEKGDVLFNRTNSFELVGKTSLFDLDGEFVFASYLVRVRTQKERLLPTFLNYYLNWEITQQRLRGMATRGVSQSNISAGKLRTFEIPLPGLPEQQKIVAALESIDAKIQGENQREAALGVLFASFLQALMTGKIRANAEG